MRLISVHGFDRLDAVQDLMNNPQFSEKFSKMARNVPDLERLISRIHAGRCKQADFLKVLEAFERISSGFTRLADMAEGFEGSSIGQLIRSGPDLAQYMKALQAMYTLTDGGEALYSHPRAGLVTADIDIFAAIIPSKGASSVCDEAADAVDAAEEALDDALEAYKSQTKCKSLTYWHSAQGQKVGLLRFSGTMIAVQADRGSLRNRRRFTTFKRLRAGFQPQQIGPKLLGPR